MKHFEKRQSSNVRALIDTGKTFRLYPLAHPTKEEKYGLTETFYNSEQGEYESFWLANVPSIAAAEQLLKERYHVR